MLTDLDKAVAKSGLPIVELPGWSSRGRPASTGSFNPKGVACHHTGSTSEARSYAEWMAYTGRSDLPAPLAQLALANDGTVYIMAAGRANHAGSSRSIGGWLAAGDGNSQLLGIEAFNSGFEGWSTGQLDAYHRLCAALCDHYGWPRSHVVAHAESSVTGKWDPGFNWQPIDMNTFRRGVAAVNLSSTPTEEDDMANYENQLGRIETKLDRALKQGRTQTTRILEELANKPDGQLTRADVREAVERANGAS